MNQVVQIVRKTLVQLGREFMVDPYLCYTEHGLHTRFLSKLYDALPTEERYAECKSKRFCIIQKEYPTAHHLGRSKRQHWDAAIIKTPIIVPSRANAFDYLPLAAVVEFGLNCSLDHLADDIERLCHPQSNVDARFVVHLYRLSGDTDKISGRDLAPHSKMVCPRRSIQEALTKGVDVEVFYGIVDSTRTNLTGLWSLTSRGEERLV
jgi:hypothetical protein